MKKNGLIFGIILFCMTIVSSQKALAHVLITDDSKEIGAVLHVAPDDDPIAGRKGELAFDLQTQGKSNTFTASLSVTDSQGASVKLPVEVRQNVISTEHTFPSQGVYKLELIAKSGRKTYLFHYSQRVSRGALGGALDKPTHSGAELALVLAGSGGLVLAILVLNKRKAISAQSRW